MVYAVLFSGVVVSLLVQAIKKYLGTSKLGSLVAVVAVSLGASAVWLLIKEKGLTDVFMNVVVGAGAFYAFIISVYEKSDEIVEEGLTFVK